MESISKNNPKEKLKEQKRAQKFENYSDLVEQMYSIQKNFEPFTRVNTGSTSVINEGYVPWTAFWDMKADYMALEEKARKNKGTQHHKSSLDELSNFKKRFVQYGRQIVFHDVLDHILNGNTFDYLSDASDSLASNLLDDKETKAAMEILSGKELSEKTSKNLSDALSLYPDASSRDEPMKEIFELLDPNDLNQIIQLKELGDKNHWINTIEYTDPTTGKVYYNRLIYEIQQPPYLELLKKMFFDFVTGQVFRGVQSLNYFKYNKKLLEAIRDGGDTESDELKNLLVEVTARQSILQDRFEQNRENFLNYQIFSQSYGDIAKFNEPTNPKVLVKMRDELYKVIEEIFMDEDFELVVRAIGSKYGPDSESN